MSDNDDSKTRTIKHPGRIILEGAVLLIAFVMLIASGVFFDRANHAQSEAEFLRQASQGRDADAPIATCDDPVVKRINHHSDPCASFYANGEHAYTLIVKPNKVIIINEEPFGKTTHKAFRKQIESLDSSYRDKIISLAPKGFVVGTMEVTTYDAWTR